MPTLVVPADPPRPGHVLPSLARDAPLTEAEAATLYEACLRDAVAAADAAGGDLIVTYPAAERVPPADDGTSLEAAVRAAVAPALDDPGEARFEVQVGSTPSARLGNVVSHLLREAGAASVGYLPPAAYHTPRTVLDGAAMKSRSADVVLGPAPDGRVHYAAFATADLNFAGALDTPALDTLAARAADAGAETAFVEFRPRLDAPRDRLGAPPGRAGSPGTRRGRRRGPRPVARRDERRPGRPIGLTAARSDRRSRWDGRVDYCACLESRWPLASWVRIPVPPRLGRPPQRAPRALARHERRVRSLAIRIREWSTDVSGTTVVRIPVPPSRGRSPSVLSTTAPNSRGSVPTAPTEAVPCSFCRSSRPDRRGSSDGIGNTGDHRRRQRTLAYRAALPS